MATIDSAGVASYSFYINRTADWGWRDQELPALSKIRELGVKVIQFGCLGMAIEPGSLVIEEWLVRIRDEDSVTLSHDLNIRPAIGLSRERELERVKRINSFSHIIKASDADVSWLFGEEDPDKLEEIYKSWSEEKLLVITKGGEGSTIYFRGEKRDTPALPTKVVDTVGAGDTFMANLLGELMALDALGEEPNKRLASIPIGEIQKATRFASAASSIVCERVGCNPPTLAEVRVKLEIPAK